jgi:hypothetical protein
LRRDGNALSIDGAGGDTQWLLVWRLDGNDWRLSTHRATDKQIAVTNNASTLAVAAALVSRTGVVGPRALLRLTP